MRRIGAVMLTIGAGGALAGVLVTQPEAAVSGPLEAHPVSRMVGEWRGTSWAITPEGQRQEGVARERARWNLAGTAILVEGYGYSEDGAGGERRVGHDAFGLIEWDAEREAVRFFTHRSGGGFEERTLEWDEETDELRWSPNDRVRFRITITEREWSETGEYTLDGGENWSQFLGMRLERVE